MLNHVVVQPAGESACRVWILPGDAEIEGDFESWALRHGDQIVFANHKMHRMLKDFHVLGNYQAGALYGYSFDDMCAIMRTKLGPSDRERVIELQEGVDFVKVDRSDGRWELFFEFVSQGGLFLIKALVMAGKFLGWMILIPMLIRIFSKRK